MHSCPTFKETQEIAKETLRQLEYSLRIVEYAGELSQIGDFFIEFPVQSHFMILSRAELLYAAVINIGWRGNPEMKSEERAGYSKFLQKYFKI